MVGTAVPRILNPEYKPRLTDNSLYILRFRYLVPVNDGKLEGPVDMFRRVAWNLADAERLFAHTIDQSTVLAYADRFFTAMTDFRFLPNAPTLLAAGTSLQQLAAAHVLPVDDSINGIFQALRMAAIVHSKGSGTGFSFSRLRPRGAPISTGGKATGPVSFMRIFNAETEAIKGGGTGWGANMGVLRCDHPDIREFVAAKSGGDGLQNFNISVGVTDDFMKLAGNNGPWVLRDPRTGESVNSVDAGKLLDLIAYEAWKTGDPGLLFLDRIERDNPTPDLGVLEATSPCGEFPMLPYEACFLGGINVATHYSETKGEIDWTALRDTCATAARMMDNAIDANCYPLDEIREATQKTRKFGIGVMGFADLLIRLGVTYGSDKCESIARELMGFIRRHLEAASQELAQERGVFPAFDSSVFAKTGPRRRNATVTANAPNSTIGAIAGCSAGIEPLFSVSYEKLLANGDRITELSPEFIRIAERRGFYSPKLIDKIKAGASLQELAEVPGDVKRIFVTAHDVSVDDHIRVQSAFQDHIELGVSKTINLPNSATEDDVKQAFLTAHLAGCKGVTCFRDGCRDRPFLEVSRKKSETPAVDENLLICH